MREHLKLEPKDFTALERDFLGPLDRDQMLAALDEPTTTHEERAIIGVRLALLGDPRPGVGLRADGLPDLVWCEVPGGEVTLEEEAGTFAVEPFHIAKYPVTYRQYRAFLEAEDGYHNPDWWQGLWVDQPPEKPGRQFKRHDNHPAENLAWLEAMAFLPLAERQAGLRGALAHRVGMAAGGHRRRPGERVSLGAGVGWEPRQHLRKRVEPHHGGGPVPARGVAGGRIGYERQCVGVLPERIR